MKRFAIVSLILFAGLAYAYTPEQQTTLDGMNLSFQLGIAYEKAMQGQNVSEFNAFVDEYNTWIRQHFGANANLLKSKINETSMGGILITPPDSGTAYLERPFNASSDLSKFGKQQAYTAADRLLGIENDLSQQELNNF